jgi:spermidine/putrescine transport system ATP-binding protein
MNAGTKRSGNSNGIKDGCSMVSRNIIELKQVTKIFERNTAVDNVTLDIREGEFLSILGPSGCGKTTTLRMIAGFEFPSSGSIVLDGQECSKLPPHKRPVNTVFQNYALFPHLTIQENVAFGLKRKGLDQKTIQKEVNEILEMMDLQEHKEKYPKQLSGGQQQRVALARALVNKPKVLLLDEPLSALDLKLRKKMQLELKRIHKQVGITFIFVTHDQDEAMMMSDRIVVMNKGKIEQVGSPEEIYHEPSSSFVADFIGDANVIPLAECERMGPSLLSQIAAHQDLKNQYAVIRPEAIAIHDRNADIPDERMKIPAVIRDVTFAGNKTIVQTEVNKQIITVHAVGQESKDILRVGNTVLLSWPRNQLKILR